MKKFIIKLSIFFLVFFILDRVLGGLCEYYFFQTRDGDTGGQVNGLLKHESQVVIFGSSRAESHYVPETLSQALGKTVYNAGFKGSNSIYDFGVEQLVIDTYKPDLIIYDFSLLAINKARFNVYEKLDPLYPYWKKPYIWDLIKRKSPFESVFFLSKIYPYNSKIHSIVIFNFLKGRPGAQNGYRPQYAVMKDLPLQENKEVQDRSDAGLVDYFKRFILLAKDNGVPVVVVCSPRFSKGSYKIPDTISSFLKEHGVPVFDFNLADYPQFLDHKLYKDRDHLNHQGALLFSSLLGEKIRGSVGTLERTTNDK